MATRFYLFLDVDGVLHPRDLVITGMTRDEMREMAHRSLSDLQLQASIRGYANLSKEPPLSRLPLLEQTLRPFLQDIEIVISSSWRFHRPSLKMLMDAMTTDIRGRVIGKTPLGGRLNDCRPDEIRAWLGTKGKPGVLAVVLDDHSRHGHRTDFDGLGIWMQLEPVTAFDDEQATKLTRILSRDASLLT